jgi:hypothetical protein
MYKSDLDLIKNINKFIEERQKDREKRRKKNREGREERRKTCPFGIGGRQNRRGRK